MEAFHKAITLQMITRGGAVVDGLLGTHLPPYFSGELGAPVGDNHDRDTVSGDPGPDEVGHDGGRVNVLQFWTLNHSVPVNHGQ